MDRTGRYHFLSRAIIAYGSHTSPALPFPRSRRYFRLYGPRHQEDRLLSFPQPRPNKSEFIPWMKHVQNLRLITEPSLKKPVEQNLLVNLSAQLAESVQFVVHDLDRRRQR